MTKLGEKLIKAAGEGRDIIKNANIIQQHTQLMELRKHMFQSSIDELEYIDRRLQALINVLEPIRQSSPGHIKQRISYISRKVDLAGKAIAMALEKVNETY